MNYEDALSGVPAGLRGELLESLTAIVRNFREGRWEPSELNGGKLCEVVYTILRGHVEGKMPRRAMKPSNMVDACRALEKADETRNPRSIRIQIPRMLMALYEIRNNRGVGHVGGDVDPNHMDAKIVVESSKWIIAELIRVFHDLDPVEATEMVEGLVDRTVKIVWEVEKQRRVLRRDLSMKDQTLLLLYSVNGPVSEKDLVMWVEHSNPSVFRRDVLRRAHKSRLLEYDSNSGSVRLSPSGIAYVEDHLPLDI